MPTSTHLEHTHTDAHMYDYRGQRTTCLTSGSHQVQQEQKHNRSREKWETTKDEYCFNTITALYK